MKNLLIFLSLFLLIVASKSLIKPIDSADTRYPITRQSEVSEINEIEFDKPIPVQYYDFQPLNITAGEPNENR